MQQQKVKNNFMYKQILVLCLLTVHFLPTKTMKRSCGQREVELCFFSCLPIEVLDLIYYFLTKYDDDALKERLKKGYDIPLKQPISNYPLSLSSENNKFKVVISSTMNKVLISNEKKEVRHNWSFEQGCILAISNNGNYLIIKDENDNQNSITLHLYDICTKQKRLIKQYSGVKSDDVYLSSVLINPSDTKVAIWNRKNDYNTICVKNILCFQDSYIDQYDIIDIYKDDQQNDHLCKLEKYFTFSGVCKKLPNNTIQ